MKTKQSALTSRISHSLPEDQIIRMFNIFESPRTHSRHKTKFIVMPSAAGKFLQVIVLDADVNPFPHKVCRPLNSTSKIQKGARKNNTRMVELTPRA